MGTRSIRIAVAVSRQERQRQFRGLFRVGVGRLGRLRLRRVDGFGGFGGELVGDVVDDDGRDDRDGTRTRRDLGFDRDAGF